MANDKSIDYINSTDYKKLEDKLKELQTVIDDLSSKISASRELRYAEVDIEGEREAQRLAPDELYIPQHIIDTNIRREQSPYVQYITQSPRAVICKHKTDPTIDLALLEQDLTTKLRYEGWQLSQFANVDGFQSNGYSIMEVVLDLDVDGEVAHEVVQYGDFAFTTDTRDLQAVEMTARAYYFTRTRLLELAVDPKLPDGTPNPNFKPDEHFNKDEVQKVIDKDPDSQPKDQAADGKDRSLYRIYKNMFRVNGIVQVAWSCPETCSDWLRIPRPLFIGRMKEKQQNIIQKGVGMVKGLLTTGAPPQPTFENVYESRYPYVLFPYLISENDTISQLKGRVYLDQDLQEAVSSLLSSIITKARRSAGLYFSKDTDDPNDDVLLQKNIYLKNGCLINKKIQAFEIAGPDPGLFNSVNSLVSMNQNETSQVNFAVNNRKDSRKTAEEVKTASQQQQILSTVQVVLFSIALTQLYRIMTDVIVSRVQANLVQVNPTVRPLYDQPFLVKPSGDIDVIEKNETIQKMTNSWPVVQNTAAAPLFLSDLLELMFPNKAARYIQAIQVAAQQQQSAQAQQQAQLMQLATGMATGIVNLSKKPEMFSETGKIHALPALEQAATQLEALEKQMKQQQGIKQ